MAARARASAQQDAEDGRPPGAAEASSLLAVAAVDALLKHPDRDPDFEPDTLESARAAIERFATQFAAAPGWVKAVVEGARAGAQGLSGDRLQGLAEIVQNADDAGATSVRMVLQPDALIVMHDGRPVTLRDILALATPWVTTKSSNASATGRFGIGLMTLQTLSPTLEVYSGLYRIRLGDPAIAFVKDDAHGAGVKPGDTVLRIPLKEGALEAQALDAWFARWDEAALLFCNHVQVVTVEADGKVIRNLRLRWEVRPQGTAEIGGMPLPVRRRYARASGDRAWAVHTADAPPPRNVRRARKAISASTPLGVALPLQVGDQGELYAGLPVVTTRQPVRINAQFDPLTGRQGLAPESPWNIALSPLITDLWVAAAVDLFETDPADAWQIVPVLEPPDDPRQSTVTALETQLLAAARNVLPERLMFDVGGRPVPLAQLATEVPQLDGILTEEEVSRLAGLDASLPRNARDAAGQWRNVLADWREAGAALPGPVTVEVALALFDDQARSADATIALAAAALADDLGDELLELNCVVTMEGAHLSPPAPTDPWLLAADAGGLASELGLARRLDPGYMADTDAAYAVLHWLRESGAIGDPTDTIGVLRRLVASGQAGQTLDRPLTDGQLRLVRDAFEPLSTADRHFLGPGVGSAITIDAFQYNRRGKRVFTTASPDATYLPRALDRDPDSFAVAAEETPGITWAHSRYAETLRSPLGRTGLGARQFLRLLGAETAPRLVPHPDLHQRYESEQRRGLPIHLLGDPPGRYEALRPLGANYTLEDRDSPDLAAVLANIGSDRKATRRRNRAAAMLATLGRSWDQLGDFAEVDAAQDYYSWIVKGPVRSFWIWRAATIPWLDDNTATPSPPAELRLRTPSTVAVHGPTANGYIHKDIPVQRHDVLAALGTPVNRARATLPRGFASCATRQPIPPP